MEKQIKDKAVYYHIYLTDGSIVECCAYRDDGKAMDYVAKLMRDALISGIRVMNEKDGIMEWYSPYQIKKIMAPIAVFAEAIKLSLNDTDLCTVKVG